MSYQEGIGCQTISCQTATGIESEPSQPEERHSHEHEGDVMRSDRMTRTVIITLADTERHDQSSHTGIDMYHGTTRKVDGSHLLQETAAPYPVSHREIGDDDPENGEKYITAELDTLGECTENQGWSNQGKHALEHHESELRNARWHDGIQTDAVEEALIETSDNASQRVAAIRIFCRESPGISEGHPYQTDYCHDEYRLHQDAEDILLAHQATVKKCNTWD